MSHHVIYVLGLGDHSPKGQQLAPKYWQLFGVQGHTYRMLWHTPESFAAKLGRLLALVDELAAGGNQVSLVGASAGAGAVLTAFAARLDKVSGVVCICGKINHPETVKPERFIENPAFKDSLAELQKALASLGPEERTRIMSLRPWSDGTVPPADTVIPGATNVVMPVAGHAFSIFVGLLFAAPAMITFLKRQGSK